MAVLGFKGERGYSAYEIAVQNGYKGTEKSWLAQLGTSSGYEKDSQIYRTKGAGETEFVLPDSYTSSSILDVYVDGVKQPQNSYTIKDGKVVFNEGISKTGALVELEVTTMTVTNLPLVTEITESSTDNTAPSAKLLYDTKVGIDNEIKGVKDTLNKVKVPAGGKKDQVLVKSTDADNEVKWENLDLLNKIYPVGSIYMSMNKTDPSTLFGGKWERIQDRFLLAAGSTYVAGTKGGEARHTIQISEMPSHDHADEHGNFIQSYIGSGSGYGYVWDGGGSKRTGKTGGGQPMPIMPPYLSVYMWQRTA